VPKPHGPLGYNLMRLYKVVKEYSTSGCISRTFFM